MPYSIGVVMAFFLAVILAGKKNRSQADTFLAFWLFFLGFHLLPYQFLIAGPIENYTLLLGLELPVPLVHGPFLYLYVRALTQENRVKESFVWHFLPFAAGLLSLILFFLLPEAEKIRVYQQQGAGYEVLLSVMYAAILVSGVLCCLLSLRLFVRYQKRISEQFSYTERINLSWLRYLILGSGVVWTVVIVAEDQQIYGAIVGYTMFIGYFGIKQVGVFTNPTAMEANSSLEAEPVSLTGEEPEKPKYEKSTLTASQIEGIHRELSLVMEEEKLFTDPELSLAQLGEHLNVHPNTLSQVINTVEQRNFFDYINRLRVEEFKRLVLDKKNESATLLALAFDCGFNSKTSFNRNFKKATGLSPSEFLEQTHLGRG
ncbi:hypothetical protein GCM10009119_22910 [Algoriphagus jejuensis]|uniref:HTH araC/xylS-type domain-containing protein n=1 Tax=Algoriphagus jejuensis TaxID=419934 RepID=A0ABP3YFQ6_9BACT